MLVFSCGKMLLKRSLKLVEKLSRVLRLCHSQCGGSGGDMGVQGLQLVKTLEKVVDPSAKICIETPMHVKIFPIDLNLHPNGDKLIMSLFSHEKDGVSEFSIKPSSNTVEVVGIKKYESSGAVCVIQAPVRASFDIQGTGVSNISIEGMHSDECSLRTKSGTVRLKNVRGKNFVVHSEEGSIQCAGTLQAEKIDIGTGAEANVTCDHIRSNNVKVNTYSGDIQVESCYSDESHFVSAMGSLKLCNIHMNCNVEILERGDLQMTGFDGTINAKLKRGNVSLQASRLLSKSSIFIHDVGIVDIKVPDSFSDMCLIDVIARQLNLENQLLKHGVLKDDATHKKFIIGEDKLHENINELLIDCRNGTVNVGVSSWKQMIESQISKLRD